jgi:hypothetical protein
MSWIDVMVGFVAGSLCSFGIMGLWWTRRLRLASGTTLTQSLTKYRLLEQDPRVLEAHSRVKACKKRLRWQMTPNPYWMAPLVDEIPKLVREIAAIYYPDAMDPLRAPGLSHFMRALHLAAMDIADFLQTCRVGRLVDVSAETVWKGWEVGHRLATHEGVKRVHTWYKTFRPWYSWARPVWQAVRFNSPWMWMSLAASNITIRTLQPAVIDIVARRAIELYSGQLAAHSSARSM